MHWCSLHAETCALLTNLNCTIYFHHRSDASNGIYRNRSCVLVFVPDELLVQICWSKKGVFTIFLLSAELTRLPTCIGLTTFSSSSSSSSSPFCRYFMLLRVKPTIAIINVIIILMYTRNVISSSPAASIFTERSRVHNAAAGDAVLRTPPGCTRGQNAPEQSPFP